jgi:hypothetical protein
MRVYRGEGSNFLHESPTFLNSCRAGFTHTVICQFGIDKGEHGLINRHCKNVRYDISCASSDLSGQAISLVARRGVQKEIDQNAGASNRVVQETAEAI